MENEILEILKRLENKIDENTKDIKDLKNGQEKLKEGQQKLEVGQQKLEVGQQKLEVRQQRLEEGQQKLEVRQQRLEEGQQRIEKKLDLTYDQVARTAEDITSIKNDMSTVETVTAKNWADIVKLKAIK